MKNQRVGVTGATGQVGATLVKRLHQRGWHVVAATRNALGAALIHANVPDCDIRVGNLSRTDGKHVLDDCETVLNCAIASSGGNPRAAYSRNRALVDGLLEAKSLRWLLHFSTVAIFGELIREHANEREAFDNPKPGSEYGRSKLYVERYAARQSAARGISGTMLRLGHVYGAGIWRSREIIEFSRDESFRLPYDGRYPSNAIHVDTLAESILALLDAAPATATFSFAERENTWRRIFDWHSGALGLPPVKAMSEEESRRMRDVWARASIPREMAQWVRGLPVKRLVRGPSMFDFALRVLVRTPTAITSRVTNINRRIGARGDVGNALGDARAALPQLYLSAGMPGPFLDLAPPPVSGAASEAERRRELREWYHVWSTPRIAASPRLERAVSGAGS